MKRALVIAMGLATAAHADPLDELGFGARSTGVAGAATADLAGAEAAHANPAALARATEPEVLVGWQYSNARYAIDGRDAGVTDAHGTTIGAAVPIALAPRVHLALGLALYLPDQYLARIDIVPVAEPQFTRLAPATQRVTAEPAVAVRIGDDLAFGAGASLLADAHSRDLTFDVGVKGGEKQGDAHLDIDLPLRAAPLASAWWRPHPRVELAATFRGQLSLDVDLDITANVDVPGVVTGTATVGLRAVTYFTPMRVALAGAIHVTDDLLVGFDVAYERWSALGSGVPDLRILVALDTAPQLVGTMQPAAGWKDIVTPRAGVEWTHDHLRLRAGGAYLPSPVPPQTGITSFADGARVLAALGAGYRLPTSGILTQPIDLDLGVAWQHVMHELVRKDTALDPGAAYASGGDLLQASASATVRF